MSSLDRFREAQDAPHAGFAVALRELEAGRKTSHWIWYVFPQLAGLGRSSTAVYYGLAGAKKPPTTFAIECSASGCSRRPRSCATHLAATKARRIRLEELMGSHIDALKLVSCMTLFQHVAKALYAVDPQPRFAAMAEHAECDSGRRGR